MNERTEQDEREAFETFFMETWRVNKPERAGDSYFSDMWDCAWQGYKAALSQASNSVAVQEPVAWLMKRGTEGKILFHKDEVNEYFDNGWRIEIELFDHATPLTSQVPEIKVYDIKHAGGIVHSDGNIFFSSIGKLNVCVKLAAAPTLDKEE